MSWDSVCCKEKICSFPSVSPGPDTQLYCSLLCGVGLRTSVRFFDYSRHKDAYKVCVCGGVYMQLDSEHIREYYGACSDFPLILSFCTHSNFHGLYTIICPPLKYSSYGIKPSHLYVNNWVEVGTVSHPLKTSEATEMTSMAAFTAKRWASSAVNPRDRAPP